MLYELKNVIEKYDEYKSTIYELDSLFEADKINIYNRRSESDKKATIIGSIVAIIVLFVLFNVFNSWFTVEKDKALGDSTICYVTNTGDCYHTIDCGYLHSSSNETTIGSARARGYRKCSKCWVSKTTHPFGAFLLAAAIGATVFYFFHKILFHEKEFYSELENCTKNTERKKKIKK